MKLVVDMNDGTRVGISSRSPDKVRITVEDKDGKTISEAIEEAEEFGCGVSLVVGRAKAGWLTQ